MGDLVWVRDADTGVGRFEEDPGGGGSFNGGTITAPLSILAAEDTTDPLFQVFDHENNLGLDFTPGIGLSIHADDGSGVIFQVGAQGGTVISAVNPGVGLNVNGGTVMQPRDTDSVTVLTLVSAGHAVDAFDAFKITNIDGDDLVDFDGAGGVFFHALPLAPGAPGQVWNDGGVLTLS